MKLNFKSLLQHNQTLCTHFRLNIYIRRQVVSVFPKGRPIPTLKPPDQCACTVSTEMNITVP